jgi:hypothetical protein
MAAIDRIHGKSGQIKMDPTGVGGATAVLVASLDKWDLDMAKATVDVTAFQDPNHVYVMGLPISRAPSAACTIPWTAW